MTSLDPATLAELVRLPAVLSVPGDAWAGAAASGNRRGWAMPLASSLIYLGGMALNDWADRRIDAEERPERPIPSGRVAPGIALAVGAGMVAGGVGLAGAIGGRAGLRVAVPLATAVGVYDVVAKDTAAGPVAMAACRTLDVLLGAAGGDLAKAVPAALLVGAHTATVTTVSQHEVHGTTAAVPRNAAIATMGTAAGAAVLGMRRRKGESAAAGRFRRGATAAAAAAYATTVGGAYAKAAPNAADPTAVRAAVGAGVMGVIPLQAGLLAGSGALVRAGIVAAAIPLGKSLRRKRAVT